MGLLRFLYFIKWLTQAKIKIHQQYKRFVPTRWRSAARWVWGVALVAGVLSWQAAAPVPPLAVYFYDVGQGDAIHVRTREGFDVLIDGGPTGRVVEKLGRTMPFWDDTIELMVLTHPHADHVVGQIEVLRRFNVEQVLATGVLHTTDEYLAWLEEIKKQDISVEIAKAGQRWELGLGAGGGDSAIQGSSSAPSQFWDIKSKLRRKAVDAPKIASPHRQPPSLAILWPLENFEGKRVREGKIGEGGGLNDTSIVTKLTYGQTSFLFMGDATAKVEEKLLKQDVRADVLKVGHHGSKYSTSRGLLKAVAPRYAVIQVGENRYGHPAFAALHRLEQAGVEVLRNDQDGDVVFESDGERVRIVK